MLLQSDDKQPWARGGIYNRWRLPDMCLARRLAAQHCPELGRPWLLHLTNSFIQLLCLPNRSEQQCTRHA